LGDDLTSAQIRIGAHYSTADVVAAVMDRIRRMIEQELQLIELKAAIEME
jgi:hypothetical protein